MIDANSTAIRNILTDVDDTFQEITLNIRFAADHEDIDYHLAGLLNINIIRTNLRRLVWIQGTFTQYTASRDPPTPPSITQIEIKATEIEDHIFPRLSSHFTNLKSLKLVSCFAKFPNHNISIDMSDTAIQTLTLSDADYEEDEEEEMDREFNPKFNATVLTAISSASTTRYFFSIDSAYNSTTSEIAECVFDTFVNGGVVDPTIVRVKFQSIMKFTMETTTCTNRKLIEINLL